MCRAKHLALERHVQEHGGKAVGMEHVVLHQHDGKHRCLGHEVDEVRGKVDGGRGYARRWKREQSSHLICTHGVHEDVWKDEMYFSLFRFVVNV